MSGDYRDFFQLPSAFDDECQQQQHFLGTTVPKNRRAANKPERSLRSLTVHWCLCYIVLVLALVPINTVRVSGADSVADSTLGKPCSIDDLGNIECGEKQRCRAQTKDDKPVCECMRNFADTNGVCLPIPPNIGPTPSTYIGKPDPKSSSGGGWVGVFLIIPTFLVLGAVGYIGVTRYKWLQRFHQLRQNRYGNVLVTRDDTDDDDPTLA